jgi:adenylosuccinate lyase
VIAFRSILKGLGKLVLNLDAIDRDLDDNWAVIAEGIQTILRREMYPSPYEALKALTRTGKRITREAMTEFIDGLDVSDKVKEELRALSPRTYTGMMF